MKIIFSLLALLTFNRPPRSILGNEIAQVILTVETALTRFQERKAVHHRPLGSAAMGLGDCVSTQVSRLAFWLC